MTKEFCHTCNSQQECTEYNDYGITYICKRCDSDTGQVPFNLSKWWLCGCKEPHIDNAYVRSEYQADDDMVFVYFRAHCNNCKVEWEWRNWVSFDLTVFG